MEHQINDPYVLFLENVVAMLNSNMQENWIKNGTPPGRGVSFVMGWFSWRNWKLVFTVEGVRLPAKNCIILETCDNRVTEREEKHL